LAQVKGQVGGNSRWDVILGNITTETGGNVGSDFQIARYADAGTIIDSPLIIERSTGIPTFAKTLRANGYAARQGTSGASYGNAVNFWWTGTILQCWIDGTQQGTFTGTLDYRVKKDVKPLESMWETVLGLNPISFQWKAHGEIFKPTDEGRQMGFVAHELQKDLLPSAASGKKDEPNMIQSINLGPVVAALTKALQEAMLRIEALEKNM